MVGGDESSETPFVAGALEIILTQNRGLANACSGLRLVYRGIRHARSERGQCSTCCRRERAITKGAEAHSLRGVIVRRIAFVLAAATGLTVPWPIPDRATHWSMSVPRTLSARWIFISTRLGSIGNGGTGLRMRISPPCRAISKVGQASWSSPPTPACSTLRRPRRHTPALDARRLPCSQAAAAPYRCRCAHPAGDPRSPVGWL
jgi:hypothetical protein